MKMHAQSARTAATQLHPSSTTVRPVNCYRPLLWPQLCISGNSQVGHCRVSCHAAPRNLPNQESRGIYSRPQAAQDGIHPSERARFLLSKEEVAGIMRMARLHNTLPALLLVLVGAWAGTGRSPAVVSKATVWMMALISAGVSAGSMLINDYFDWMSGADQINSPEKPLPSGLVKPDMAVLMAGSMYVAVLMAACLMDNPAIRAIVAFSAGATLLYTPVFKKVTMVKNALVACVIALAPLSGALAAGAGGPMLQRLAVPSLFAFTSIMYREVLMDCADEAGDRDAGVNTLPVMLGPGRALLVATSLLILGGVAGVATLLRPYLATLSHALMATPAWPHLACAAILALFVGQMVWQAVQVYKAGFSQSALASAIEGCMKPIGLSIIMLAAMA